jgi:hypothetical protein
MSSTVQICVKHDSTSSTVHIGVEHDSTSSTIYTGIEHNQIACWLKATCPCSTVAISSHIVMVAIGMMSIYYSSWLSSHFLIAIDGFKHAHQRSWPSAEDYIYFSQTYELGTFFLHSENLASHSHWLERRSTCRFTTPSLSPERKRSNTGRGRYSD